MKLPEHPSLLDYKLKAMPFFHRIIYKLFRPIAVELKNDIIVSLPYEVQQNVLWAIFSSVDIQGFRKILDEMEKRGIDYTSMADIYGLLLRDNLKKSNDDRIHAYYELLPKLDEYRKAFRIDDFTSLRGEGK